LDLEELGENTKEGGEVEAIEVFDLTRMDSGNGERVVEDHYKEIHPEDDPIELEQFM
jgi:hypothetical protein